MMFVHHETETLSIEPDFYSQLCVSSSYQIISFISVKLQSAVAVAQK